MKRPSHCAQWVLTNTLVALLSLNVPEGLTQETQYISDTILVPVREGAGPDEIIINRGLPSGTLVLVFQQSEDSEWTEIETRAGTRGWIRSKYLQIDPPAALLMTDIQVELAQVQAERDRLLNQLNARSSEADEADGTISELNAVIESTRAELTEIKRVSSATIELDLMNQQLVAELESERSESDLLRLENVRLRERIANNQILDGALAVLLGVLLALIAPRLWPSKKRSDGWT